MLKDNRDVVRGIATFLDRVMDRYRYRETEEFIQWALPENCIAHKDTPNFETKRSKMRRMSKEILQFFNESFREYQSSEMV